MSKMLKAYKQARRRLL